MKRTRKRRSMTRELAKGAVAGVVATAVMNLATTYLYQHESPRAKRREQRARGGQTAYESAAEAGAEAAGVDLDRSERAKAGTAIHWVLGAAAGAVYAGLRPRFGGFDLGRGLGFGTGFWLLVDEAVTPLLGLTPGPGAFPWQTHVRGLAGHLVFGAVADSTLDVLDRFA